MNEEDFFVVDKNKAELTKQTTYYDKNGKAIIDGNKHYFLKKVTTSKQTKYFLLFDQATLADPLGDDTFLRNYKNLSEKKVSEKIGKLYLRYLEEKNSRFFTLCRRDLNG